MGYRIRRNFACACFGALSGTVALGQAIHGARRHHPAASARGDGRSGHRRLLRDQDSRQLPLARGRQQPRDQGVHRRRKRLHSALYGAGAHPPAGRRRSGRSGAGVHVDHAHPARQRLFFEKRLAGEDQASIYVRHGWTGKDKRLVDPAQFSRDPNTSVDLVGRLARRHADGLRGARGRRGRNHRARVQREDRQDALETSCPAAVY